MTTYKEGNGKKVIERKRPGKPKYSEVTLKRGFTTNKVIHDWFKEVVDATKPTPYKTASIVIYDRQQTECGRFSLEALLAVEDVGLRPQRRQRRRDGRGADDPARVPRLGEALTVAGLQTEFAFTLPKGYVDGDGVLHRHGTMRLATARDEIEPLRDQRVDGADDPYLTILVISRVITELGTLRQVTPNEVEGLFAADLAFLQDLYGIINFGDPADVEVLQRAVLPAARARAGAESAERRRRRRSTARRHVDRGRRRSTPPRTSRARGQIEEVPSHASGR